MKAHLHHAARTRHPIKPLIRPDGQPAQLAPLQLPSTRIPVVLSLGMGLESLAILIRWLLDPLSRDFALTDLIVISAQVGHESVLTKAFMEQIALPLMHRHQVRYIQAARAGPSEHAGVVLLDDSREPWICHTEGHYTLMDELRTNGTLPQYASGKRLCSVKYKGFVLDQLLARLMGSRPFRHIIGFNHDEQERIARDQSFASKQKLNRMAEYPLLSWKWGRAECAAYLLAAVGEVPRKSACSCCPFPNGVRGCGRSEDMLERYRAFPDDCAETLFLEYVAAALNPRMTLYPGGKSILQITQEEDNTAALSRFAERLAATTWALYRVRRIYYAPGRADRSVERINEGSQDTCQAALETIATISSKMIECSGVGQHPRVYLRRPGSDGPFPRLEEQFVLAPAVVIDKQRERFEATWRRLISAQLLRGVRSQPESAGKWSSIPSLPKARKAHLPAPTQLVLTI